MTKEQGAERAEKLISFVKSHIPNFPVHIPPMVIEDENAYHSYIDTTASQMRNMEPLTFYWKNLGLRLKDLKEYYELNCSERP